METQDLITLARQGRLSKQVLVKFLAFDKRKAYLDTCAAIEKHYTEACTAKNDPCLAGGCAAEGEICLQPLEEAGIEYYKACGEAFADLFADPLNRAEAWAS